MRGYHMQLSSIGVHHFGRFVWTNIDCIITSFYAPRYGFLKRLVVPMQYKTRSCSNFTFYFIRFSIIIGLLRFSIDSSIGNLIKTYLVLI